MLLASENDHFYADGCKGLPRNNYLNARPCALACLFACYVAPFAPEANNFSEKILKILCLGGSCSNLNKDSTF